MDLIDAYIYEVTRRIAKNKRNATELELKSTIEDMLPDNYSELEVKEVLMKLGNPAKLAVNYQNGPKYLIGPEMYSPYIQTIKLIIPWAILITIIVHLVKSILLFPGEEIFLTTIIHAFSITIANIIGVVLQVLFWVTIAFIIAERYSTTNIQIPFITGSNEWTPEDLNKIIVNSKSNSIPLSDIIFSFLGIAFFSFIYFNASRLIGIYSSDDRIGLKFVMPIFNQDTLLSFKPIIICWIVLSFALTLYRWKVRQWTMPIAITSALLQCFGTIVFIVMAKQPDLIHSAAIPYMAAIMETTSTKIMVTLDRILFVCIVITILASAFDIYSGFKKAKLNKDEISFKK
ncbi:HAAS signaling domain-containing protein [Lysinibacillus sp. NPDC093712]|uniref:HAAS signaling domain-containing protein n=1 Tax=Lysinibacillus sp. NPDC093712 TaxID=3390579 RepID=UPI003D043536